MSKRAIVYYEQVDAQPPGAMLPALAAALSVSADELLGIKNVVEKGNPRAARLLKRLQKLTELPAADQRALLKIIDGFLAGRSAATAPRRRAA